MNAGCGAGELSPGQTWTWNEAKTSDHLLVRSVTPQAVGAIVGAALDGDGDRCLLLQETQDGIRVFDGDDIADAILSSLGATGLLLQVLSQISLFLLRFDNKNRWLVSKLQLETDGFPMLFLNTIHSQEMLPDYAGN